MSSKRNNRKTNRKSGSGYLQPAEYYTPSAVQPSGNAVTVSSAPTPGWIRPPMAATTVVSPNLKVGGKRKTRKNMFGGFAPAIMGSFVSNVQSAIVPLVLYGLYSAFGTNKTAKAVKNKVGSSRKAVNKK